MLHRSILRGFFALAVALVFCPASRAVTITFDELPTQAVNGLSLKGVTFGFTVGGVASTDATFNTNNGPGLSSFITPPNLEGNSSGVLTLTFAAPVTSIQAGVALNSTATFSPGFSVQLFDTFNNSLGTTGVNTAPAPIFSEGQFNYSGVAVSKAVVTFSPGTRFAMDNLSFAPVAVPEPATVILGSLAIPALGLFAWKRRTTIA